MFIILFSDSPTREVKAEEVRVCSNCKKKTIHRYEEICFHAKALFVNLFCMKKRYARLCSECNFGVNLEEDEFKREMEKLVPPKGMPGSPNRILRFEHSKDKGITYCNQCGERIFPDIGYCTSCAVRKPGKGSSSGPKVPRAKASSPQASPPKKRRKGGLISSPGPTTPPVTPTKKGAAAKGKTSGKSSSVPKSPGVKKPGGSSPQARRRTQP